MSDKQVPLAFPVKGLNVATSYGQQPEESTPVGVNVRAFESQYGRGRGGSRPGLSKYIADTVPAGAHLIQHLNIIVDPQAPALLGDTDPTVPDPSSNNLRQRYPANRKYRPGGSAVKPKVVAPTGGGGGPITFIQKKVDQPGNVDGRYSLTLDDPVTVGNVVFVIVRTEKAGTTAIPPATVRNAGQIDYTQVGGNGYYAQATDATFGTDSTHTLSVYYRPVQTADDITVEVTLGVTAITEVMMLEYQGPATDGPVSNQCKASDQPTGTTFTLPDLALDGTDGQMVIAAFLKINTNLTPVGDYMGRFGAGGATPANTGVTENKPLSGAAPENPAVTSLISRKWCGIAAAITR